MVVCKYFLEGYCRFGNHCKFEHANAYSGGYRTDPGQSGGRSILKSESSAFGGQRYDQGFVQGSPVQNTSFMQGSPVQNTSFGHSPIAQSNSFLQSPAQDTRFLQNNAVNYQQRDAAPASPGMRYNVHEIMNVVLKDIQQVERGGQWQLSAYSPLKDLVNLPGLEDVAPEELRWQSYQAVQGSTFPLWQAMVQQLYAHVAKVYNDLKKKETGYGIIDKWLREGHIDQSTSIQVNQSPFGGGSFSSFGSAPAASQPFSQPAGTSSSFSFSLTQQPPAMFPSTVSVFESSPLAAPAHPPPPPFSSFPTAVAPPRDINAYSTVEELSERELDAFKAERFTLGAIPTKPPPQLFCDI